MKNESPLHLSSVSQKSHFYAPFLWVSRRWLVVGRLATTQGQSTSRPIRRVRSFYLRSFFLAPPTILSTCPPAVVFPPADDVGCLSTFSTQQPPWPHSFAFLLMIFYRFSALKFDFGCLSYPKINFNVKSALLHFSGPFLWFKCFPLLLELLASFWLLCVKQQTQRTERGKRRQKIPFVNKNSSRFIC